MLTVMSDAILLAIRLAESPLTAICVAELFVWTENGVSGSTTNGLYRYGQKFF